MIVPRVSNLYCFCVKNHPNRIALGNCASGELSSFSNQYPINTRGGFHVTS